MYTQPGPSQHPVLATLASLGAGRVVQGLRTVYTSEASEAIRPPTRAPAPPLPLAKQLPAKAGWVVHEYMERVLASLGVASLEAIATKVDAGAR